MIMLVVTSSATTCGPRPRWPSSTSSWSPGTAGSGADGGTCTLGGLAVGHSQQPVACGCSSDAMITESPGMDDLTKSATIDQRHGSESWTSSGVPRLAA